MDFAQSMSELWCSITAICRRCTQMEVFSRESGNNQTLVT